MLDDYGFNALRKSVVATSVHMTVDVDEHRNDHCVTTRLGLRAVSQEVSHFPVAIAGLESGEASQLLSVHGGRVARSTHLVEPGVQAWEVELERPIRTNETCVFEFALALPRTRHDYSEYYVEQQVRELVIWVRFTPGTTPRAAELYDDSSGVEVVTPLDVEGLSALSFSAAPYGPGRAGVRRTW